MHYQINRDCVPYLLLCKCAPTTVERIPRSPHPHPLLVYMIQVLQGDSFKCVQDGFFPDKHDCWIYHICVGATHSVKACKEDLLFNPTKNECDWAMNVMALQRLRPKTLPLCLGQLQQRIQRRHRHDGGDADGHWYARFPLQPIGTDACLAFCRLDLDYRVTPFANASPSKNKHSPATGDSIFDYLCRSVDNDYIAHPTDCKRYAYCANSKRNRSEENIVDVTH